MILKIILTLIASIVSGVLGRMGGAAGYNTLYRDVGCSVICCLVIGLWGGFHWTLIFVFGLMWGALSTYFKKKGTNSKWYNWLLVGLAFSLSCLPYIGAQNLWLGFGLRSLVLPLLVMGWCLIINNAVVEEFGRYALLILSIPLLFILKGG